MNISKKVTLLDLKLKRDLGQDFFGLHKSIFYGTGTDFAEHREYIAGDSIKHIDWKASAKSGKMFTKQFEEDRDLKVLFLLDTGKSMAFGSGETTKKQVLEELFYGLAISAYSSGDSLGAYIFGGKSIDFFPVTKKQRTIFDILSALDSTTSSSNTNFGSVLETIKQANIKGHFVVILTDNNGIESYNKELSYIAKTNELVCINIVDTFEEYLYETPQAVSFLAGNIFSQITLKNTKKIETYRELRKQKKEKRNKFFASIRSRYIVVETEEDIFRKLLSIK